MALSHFNGEINIFRTNEKNFNLFVIVQNLIFFNQEKNLEPGL